MGWHLDKNRPICPQICEQISVEIANGKLLPNEKLLSVREVAVSAGVNPNTVQKAFEELERMGLIYSVRSSGWYVGNATEVAKATVEEMKAAKAKTFIEAMQSLGLTTEQAIEYIKGVK